MTDSRAVQAAANNGDWYAMMFDIHGLRYRLDELAFSAEEPPPAFHSGMVVLSPGRAEAVVDLIPTRAAQPRFGIKDSFVELPLDVVDLAELFTASWIWADTISDADTAGWERITDRDRLYTWELAWRAGGSPTDRRQFPDRILERQDVAVFGRLAGSTANAGFDAGVIANLSGECVGLSNAFGPADAYRAGAARCADFGDGRPVVGYERGDDLTAALAAGFVTTGQLRVAYRTPDAQSDADQPANDQHENTE
ncbi:MAG: hypothetical protein AAGA65_09535 [Actinomycetota bacterium]